MRVVTTVQEMVQIRQDWIHKQAGLVPTMGYLHQGHLSLVQQARAENEVLLASIFVNPTQFGPHEDLSNYPRAIEHDLQLLETMGVDVIFLPSTQEIYPPGFVTYVDVTGPLSTEVEGASRPGHFRGVATIVLKLFQITQPHLAYFGQKDAQQVAVISRMVNDFNLPITLRILSTVREADGLAMSSRNSYLDPASRAASTILYKALKAGQRAFDAHIGEEPRLVLDAMQAIIATEPLAQLDYIELRDPTTFLPLTRLTAPAVLLIAAHIGPARLIDNFLLRADHTWDEGVTASTQTTTSLHATDGERIELQ